MKTVKQMLVFSIAIIIALSAIAMALSESGDNLSTFEWGDYEVYNGSGTPNHDQTHDDFYSDFFTNPQREPLYFNTLWQRKWFNSGWKNYKYALYTIYIQCPFTPQKSTSVECQNEAIQVSMQFYDGSTKYKWDATVYWKLNPWSDDYKKIGYYRSDRSLQYLATIEPGLGNWHKISIKVDIQNRKILWIAIDGTTYYINEPMYKEYKQDWDTDISNWINVEVENAYGSQDYKWIGWGRFKDYSFIMYNP